ncbi:FRG domain-containing protein [Thiocapsa roseopersicina]|uniref:FRG domain-containing protein n=1 Tax=Thiocapsa roseopersicina TaxID=1058 RepID=UPI0015872E69|nr:FRG domain-containing protein [Thiocapsa roseopersicina]
MTVIDKTYIEFHPESWEQAKNFASRYSEWIFRGQSKASYGLETSIERAARIHGVCFERIEEYEKSILKTFQRQAHHFLSMPPHDNEVLEWLSIIQHHGGPTRLLDFTYSFYIACYFALQDADDESAVWCVNRSKLEKSVQTSVSLNVGEAGREGFGAAKIIVEALFGDLKETMAMPVEPFRKSMRLSLQQGLFVFPFNIRETFENNIFSTLASGVEKLNASVTQYEHAHMLLGTFPVEGRLLKICLNKSLHNDIRKDLSRMNVNPASLFPGLDGFAKSLASCVY